MSDPTTNQSGDEEGTNRVTDPIATQEEADGLRASLQERQAIPPAEMTPVQEDAIALDQSRLAQWDADNPVPASPPETDDVPTEAADDTEEADL